eukprot:6839655-Ditylum_brightwellii.AAC.1
MLPIVMRRCYNLWPICGYSSHMGDCVRLAICLCALRCLLVVQIPGVEVSALAGDGGNVYIWHQLVHVTCSVFRQ